MKKILLSSLLLFLLIGCCGCFNKNKDIEKENNVITQLKIGMNSSNILKNKNIDFVYGKDLLDQSDGRSAIPGDIEIGDVKFFMICFIENKKLTEVNMSSKRCNDNSEFINNEKIVTSELIDLLGDNYKTKTELSYKKLQWDCNDTKIQYFINHDDKQLLIVIK